MKDILQKSFVQFGIVLGILIIAYVSMYPPEVLFFKKISNYGIQTMILLMLTGVFFLFFRVPKLTFACFGSVVLMSLFFKTSTNFSMDKPIRTFSPSFDFAFFKTSNFGANYQEFLELPEVMNKDIIGIQEYTPDWKYVLDSFIAKSYPYKAEFLQINDFGQVIYSKFPITDIDTLGSFDNQSLVARIEVDEKHRFVILSNYNLTPTHTQAFKDLGLKLNRTSEYLKNYPEKNILIFGAFNLVSWDLTIGEFKKNLNLSESRREFFPSLSEGANGLLQKPVDHIFTSSGLECLNFDLFSYQNANQGVIGQFQFKLDE